MLTIVFRHSAAAGLMALALVASTYSSAHAGGYTARVSCVGGWGIGTCVYQERYGVRDTHVRKVRTDSEVPSPEAVARDRKWLNFCKPVVYTDTYGVSRYHYEKPGCEFGRSE